MEAKFKIIVIGIGGVGGYYGAKLAAYYANSDKAEVIFIARGENEKAIRENGLTIITSQSQDTIFPGTVTSDPAKIGKADLIICCVKNYDLDSSIVLLNDCITDKTIIIPLLNGVNASERIRTLYPKAKVWEACVYIISKLVSPGVIKEGGTVNQLYFGSESASQEDLHIVYDILNDAGINVFLSTNIMHTIWEKFLFISPFATVTSWLDIPIGKVLEDNEHKAILDHLIDEITIVARVKGLNFPMDIKDNILNKMKSVPFETLSSMHSDFRRSHKTELEAITGAVINYAKDTGVSTPYYERIYRDLKQRTLN